MRVLIVLLALLAASQASAFSYATGDCATAGCAEGEAWLYTNANEVDAALDALEARDTIAEHESVDGVNVILATEIDTSAELRGILGDETGTGAAVFAGGAIGAATATTPAANDSDTSVATTAYVQGEINGAGGTDLTCASGQCNVDAGVTRDTEWDTIAEIEAATSVDILTTTETFTYTFSATTPSGPCTAGDLWANSSVPALYLCTATDTWSSAL